MGMSLFGNCSTNYVINTPAPAPNPNPERWELLDVMHFKHGYVLVIKYLDCTNFEGVKCMVYRGSYGLRPVSLDPHFTDDPKSPIARFRPDEEGLKMAMEFADSLKPQKKGK